MYEYKDLDREVTGRARGGTLLEKGLVVSLPRCRRAALITYRSIRSLAAVVSASPDTCEVLQELAFSAEDSRALQGEIVDYSWDFGDGSNAAGVTANHAYSAPGDYTVRLTVRDRQGAVDTASTTISARPPDTTLPAMIDVAAGDPEKIVVIFNKPVERTRAETTANYSIDPGSQILSAVVEPDLATVTLKTSRLHQNKNYTLSVSNIRDRARIVHTIAPNSRQEFRYSGMFAWWKLDDGQGDLARDFSGNGHHAILNGPQEGPKWVSSDRGTVLSFSGAGDFVESDTFFPDLAMPFSIMLWVNPAATQVEYADIFGNHGEPFVGISLQQDGQNLNSYGFGFGDGRQWQGGVCPVEDGPVAARGRGLRWRKVSPVCRWCRTQSGSGQRPVAANPNQNFKLGQGYHSGRYFHGLLSDVRIYRKARIGHGSCRTGEANNNATSRRTVTPRPAGDTRMLEDVWR